MDNWKRMESNYNINLTAKIDHLRKTIIIKIRNLKILKHYLGEIKVSLILIL
jgi:hypothetical protein